MKLTFKIHYFTQWGQQIAVTGDAPELGNNRLDRAFLLTYTTDGYWEGVVDLADGPAEISYKYLLVDGAKGSLTEEWGAPRRLQLPEAHQLIWVKDFWRSHESEQNAFYSSAFQEVIFRPAVFPHPQERSRTEEEVILRFKMEAPQVPSGLQLGVIGDIEELGNWNQDRLLLLGNEAHPVWQGEVRFPKYRAGKISYKYCLYDPQAQQTMVIEAGANRELEVDTFFDKEMVVVTDLGFSHPDGPWKGAGLAIPVFSIRTRQSLGVGEFVDLKLMVDWAVSCGLKMVQILPVNDTSGTGTWTDSYPYAAISVFALHPIYLNLDRLPISGRKLSHPRKKLNALPQVDYEAVMETKLRLARAAYQENRESFLSDPEFKTYLKENKDWLVPYAVFCYLRDQYGTADFNQWRAYARYKKTFLRQLAAPGAESYPEVAFYYFLQFHLDKQLREAADYAREKGVVLKGDLPIGIYRYSADAWVAPELYNMDGQSGAPPDPFSETGQNWGFPTYRWEVMKNDGYRWWKKRMQQLAHYFDAYRIDHILGFFRIWEIPIEQVDGLLGVFNPAIPVTLAEFAEWEIPFEYQRFCTPYLTESILRESFGKDLDLIQPLFFETDTQGRIQFRSEVNTQRKILAFFEYHPALAAKKEDLIPALFALIGNVLFLPDKNAPQEHFHPRIKMMETSSFQALESAIQHRLEALYQDYFYHRQERFWEEKAMEKLPALRQATDMLICGEDLGMVPACVPGVMRALNILSLEIQRMSKNPATEFLQEEEIPYLSVASPSTHDMSPIRAWWEEADWEQMQRFYEQELKMIGDHPFYCEPYIAQAIINQHLGWPSMWTVFPVQDLLAMDGRLRHKDPFSERINVPANPKHYWRYRMHIPIEDLLAENGFNKMLRSMLETSKRLGAWSRKVSAD